MYLCGWYASFRQQWSYNQSTKKIVTNKFNMKNLGVTNIILGTKLFKTSNGLILSQGHYIEKVFKKFSKDDNITVKIPIDISV
jgi:hypothetical protein